MTSSGTGAQRSSARRQLRSDDDEFFAPPESVATLPEPEPLLRALALQACEVIAGARRPEQLARWVTDDVCSHLRARATIAARARAVTGQATERPRLSVLRVRYWTCESGGIDAVVVVYDTRRGHAVSLHLDGMDHRWRASVIAVM